MRNSKKKLRKSVNDVYGQKDMEYTRIRNEKHHKGCI